MQAAYAYPVYEAAIAGFGAFGATDYPRSDWNTRTTTAKYAINSALAYAGPAATGQLMLALAQVFDAASVIDFAAKNDQWTEQQEEHVASALEKGRALFGAAQGMNAASGGAMFPVPYPTWVGAAMGIPSGGAVPVVTATNLTPKVTAGGGVLTPAVPGAGGTVPVVAKAGIGMGGMIAIGVLAWLFMKKH